MDRYEKDNCPSLKRERRRIGADGAGGRAVLDAEAAVRWAVVEQRAAASGRRSRLYPQLLAALVTQAGERAMAGELLPGAAVHPDAVWLAVALLGLPGAARRLLLEHAWAGTRPDWRGLGRAGFRPVLRPGRGLLVAEPVVVVGAWGDGSGVEGERAARRRRAVGRFAEDRRDPAAGVEAEWCPVVDLAGEAAEGRAAWTAWRAGLLALAEAAAALRAAGRMRLVVLPPACAAEPWAVPERPLPGRGERDDAVLSGEARAAFARDAAAGLPQGELAARYGLSPRQAKDLRARTQRSTRG